MPGAGATTFQLLTVTVTCALPCAPVGTLVPSEQKGFRAGRAPPRPAVRREWREEANGAERGLAPDPPWIGLALGLGLGLGLGLRLGARLERWAHAAPKPLNCSVPRSESGDQPWARHAARKAASCLFTARGLVRPLTLSRSRTRTLTNLNANADLCEMLTASARSAAEGHSVSSSEARPGLGLGG